MFKDRLGILRKERNKTQQDVATALGIPTNTYRSYEKDEREPPSDILIALAKMYNVSLDWLLGLSEYRNSIAEKKPTSKIAARISAVMTEREINTAKLAELTDIPFTTLDKVLRGETKNPSSAHIAKIAKALSISSDYLLGLTDTPKADSLGIIKKAFANQLERLEKESDTNPDKLPELTNAMCELIRLALFRG